MNILSAEKITKLYGPKVLFSDLSFGIEFGEKIGLIGINGTGKTTLLKILVGAEFPDAGQVIRAVNSRIGYLPQNPWFAADHTVLETVLQGDSPEMKLLREYEAVLRRAEHHPQDAGIQENLVKITAAMDEAHGWELEKDAKTILTQLAIPDFEAPVAALSGGQRKRVALAAALIHPVELLILDEPTNHIDNQTVAWLEQYLKQRSGALLMVTHDRYFLDRVAGRILELDQGKIYSYSGNYSVFLEKKAEREELALATAAKRQNLFRRELAWIRRGAKARSTKQQARMDRFATLQEQMAAHDGASQPLELTAGASRLGKKVVIIEGLGKDFAGKTVIADFNYTLQREDRVGIIGPNGSGKTTLLNLITGQLAPDRGSVAVGPTVQFGLFEQEYPPMDENLRALDYIKAVADFITTPDGGSISAAQMMERFLFPGALQWTPIAKLSGGEKRRLYLLRVLMSAPNVFLLDEPTNDLDIQTLRILEEYLEDFPGVVVAVSHDRYFLDRICRKLLVFEGNGTIRHFVGNYSGLLSATEQDASVPAGVKLSSPDQGPRKKERPLKLSFNEQRELETIDAVIADVERELAEIRLQIERSGSDFLALQKLLAMQESLENRLSALMERWAYLNQLAEDIAKQKN